MSIYKDNISKIYWRKGYTRTPKFSWKKCVIFCQNCEDQTEKKKQQFKGKCCKISINMCESHSNNNCITWQPWINPIAILDECYYCVFFFFKFQIQDVIFSKDGSEFFSTGDLVSRDSSDRNIMAWDFDNAVVKSNQIYQVRILIALMWKIKFKIKYQWTKKKFI